MPHLHAAWLLVGGGGGKSISGSSYRVELVENFHQVLLQLHPDLFALPRQEGKRTMP